MLKISKDTNLLKRTQKNVAVSGKVPNYYREVFSYKDVPKIPFEDNTVPMDMPKEVWITDTTFRDGLQAVEPYTEEQTLKLFSFLSKLAGEQGRVRQTEFFVYGKKNLSIIEKCRALGYKFPEITTWIRAKAEDLKIVKNLGAVETGILISVSDYQIYKKLRLNREEAFKQYVRVVSEALQEGIIPRCHFEDLTRADMFGFVVPLVNELTKIAKENNLPIKFRLCDTLGLAVPYARSELPRSVPKLIHAFRQYCDIPSENLEWHGHNDFYKAVVNGSASWMYGCSAVNCSLLGRGERTGNIPLEAMVFEYASLKGDFGGMQPTVITEIAEYYRNEIGFNIPETTPFVGEYFNVTRAGIHADGLMKDEEIYNIFDTGSLLNLPPQVQIGQNSGAAGIAYWINTMYHLKDDEAFAKNDAIVLALKKWVDEQYETGRQTLLATHELENEIYILTSGKYGKQY